MTDLDKLIAAAVAVAEAMPPEERAAMMEAQRQSWARGEAGLRETSASPPRVRDAGLDETEAAFSPHASTESGPGQPMIDVLPGEPAINDHAGFLDALANTNMPLSSIVPRLRLAAAEIRRLRAEQAALERILDQQQIAMPRTDGERRPLIDRVTIACWAANDKEDEKRGYRAGIEAALGAIEILLREPHYTAQDYTAFHRAFDAIRALADALKSEGG